MPTMSTNLNPMKEKCWKCLKIGLMLMLKNIYQFVFKNWCFVISNVKKYKLMFCKIIVEKV